MSDMFSSMANVFVVDHFANYFPLTIYVPTLSFVHFMGPNSADMQPTILFRICASQLSSLGPMGLVFGVAMSRDPIVLSISSLCPSSIIMICLFSSP